MSAKSKSKPDDPARSKRFIETAKELVTDERPEEFERVFRTIVPPNEQKRRDQ